MAKLSRDRGNSFEREVANLLQEHLGVAVKRQLGQARDGGADILLPPFTLECKRVRRLGRLYGWLRQAEAAAAADRYTPIVVARADGEQPLVLLRLLDFVRLAREEISK